MYRLARATGRIIAGAFLAIALDAVVLLTGAPALAVEGASPPATGLHLQEIFDSFYNIDLDTAQPLPVNDLVITRDVLKLTLEQGVLHLAEPIEGRITGAYFAGRGTMRLKPPSGVARKALKRKYGRERIEEAFTELMLRFNDDTDRELQAATTPAPAGDRSPSATWEARSRIQFNSDDLQPDFIESLFSPRGDPRFFVADMKTSQGWISFNFRQRQRIEIGLFRERVSGTAGKRLYEPWCAFHRRQGLRIDLLLATPAVAKRVRSVEIDRDYRKKKDGLTASDHAPVMAVLE